MEDFEIASSSEEPAKKSRTGFFLILALVLLVLGAAAANFFVYRTAADDTPPSLSLDNPALQGFIGVETPVRIKHEDGSFSEVAGEFLEIEDKDVKTAAEITALEAEFGSPLKVASSTMIYFPDRTKRIDVLERAKISKSEVGVLSYTVTWEPFSGLDAKERMVKPFFLMPDSIFSTLEIPPSSAGTDDTVPADTIQAVYFATKGKEDVSVLNGSTLEIYGAVDGTTEPDSFTFDKEGAMGETWYLVAAPHDELAEFAAACKDQIRTIWYQNGLKFGQFARADLDNFKVDPDYYFAWIKTEKGYDYSKCTKPVSDTTAPSKPAPISSEEHYSSVELTWGASTDNVAVKGYIVSYEGIDKPIDVGNVLSYNVAGLRHLNTYDFSVFAYDAAGNISSPATISDTPLVPTTREDLAYEVEVCGELGYPEYTGCLNELFHHYGTMEATSHTLDTAFAFERDDPIAWLADAVLNYPSDSYYVYYPLQDHYGEYHADEPGYDESLQPQTYFEPEPDTRVYEPARNLEAAPNVDGTISVSWDAPANSEGLSSYRLAFYIGGESFYRTEVAADDLSFTTPSQAVFAPGRYTFEVLAYYPNMKEAAASIEFVINVPGGDTTFTMTAEQQAFVDDVESCKMHISISTCMTNLLADQNTLMNEEWDQCSSQAVSVQAIDCLIENLSPEHFVTDAVDNAPAADQLPAYTPPVAPITNLAAVVNPDHTVTFTWTPSVDKDYLARQSLYRRDEGEDWDQSTKIHEFSDFSIQTYTDAFRDPGTYIYTFYLEVSRFDSDQSAVISVTVPEFSADSPDNTVNTFNLNNINELQPDEPDLPTRPSNQILGF